jgi:hypothetical protein
VTEAAAGQGEGLAAGTVCVRSNAAQDRQNHYHRELLADGWTFTRGEANVTVYGKAGRCLGVAVFPLDDPRGKPERPARRQSDWGSTKVAFMFSDCSDKGSL